MVGARQHREGASKRDFQERRGECVVDGVGKRREGRARSLPAEASDKGGSDRGSDGRPHEVSILSIDAGVEGLWRGRQPWSNVSMITMRLPQCGQG